MSDAFAGFKLTEVIPPASASIDQRLFTTTPPAAPVPERPPPALPAPVPSVPNPAKRAPVVRVNGNVIEEKVPLVESKPEVPLDAARSERPLSEPEAKSVVPFDINVKPYRKDSFMFTDAEFDRMEDLKLELRRRFELPATKNDIARCALHILFEDYARDPERSRVVRQLRLKK